VSALDGAGLAIVIAALTLGAFRLISAVVEAHALGKRADHTGEVLHHVDQATVVLTDLLTALEGIAEDTRAIRDAAERLAEGGAR
jgi:hypothetical protein